MRVGHGTGGEQAGLLARMASHSAVVGHGRLAGSAQELQRALDIAATWARKVRMRWNVGPKKSAVMVWGRGRARGNQLISRRQNRDKRFAPDNQRLCMAT